MSQFPGNGEAEPCQRVVYWQWDQGQCPLRLPGVTKVSSQKESGTIDLQATDGCQECGLKVSTKDFPPIWQKNSNSQKVTLSPDIFVVLHKFRFFYRNYLSIVKCSKGIHEYMMKDKYVSKPDFLPPEEATVPRILLPEPDNGCTRTHACVRREFLKQIQIVSYSSTVSSSCNNVPWSSFLVLT